MNNIINQAPPANTKTTPNSAFKRSCAELTENGYVAIPIQPCEKRPHAALGKNWGRFAETPPTDDELEHWCALKDAGIGVLTGKCSGIIGLDFDEDVDGVHAVIKAALPPTTVIKIGARGETWFYQYSGEKTGVFRINGETVIEVLSCGRQTVTAPTIHPNTGKPYYYPTGDTLENTRGEDMPILPEDASETIASIIAAHGGEGSGATSGESLGSELRDIALMPSEQTELIEALKYIGADDYHGWVHVGMALRSAGGTGKKIWLEWSAQSAKYDQGKAETKWKSFKYVESGLTFDSIFKWGRANGWPGPVLPDYGAQLLAGQEERRMRAAATGLHFLFPSDLGDIQPPNWLIKKHLVADSMAMLYGPSGVGKSFVALDMGLSVAAGIEWQGHETQQGLVLYICGEGKAGINARVRAWCKGRSMDPEVLPFAVSSSPVALLDVSRVNELIAVIERLDKQPVLIIIDTVNRNFGSGDENSTKDMGAFVDALGRLQAITQACIKVVHHTGLADAARARGSSALRAALDTEMALKGVQGGIVLECTKQKDAEEFSGLGFELDTVPVGVDEDGQPITSCVLSHSDKAAGHTLASQLINGATGAAAELLALVPDTGVEYSQLRTRYMQECASDKTSEAARKSYSRSFNTLQGKQLIEICKVDGGGNMVLKL